MSQCLAADRVDVEAELKECGMVEQIAAVEEECRLFHPHT